MGQGEIKIIQFRGKNGGFAIDEQDLWRVVLQGLNGQETTLLASSPSKKEANLTAARWHGLTEFQVVEYHTKYTTTTELIKQ